MEFDEKVNKKTPHNYLDLNPWCLAEIVETIIWISTCSIVLGFETAAFYLLKMCFLIHGTLLWKLVILTQ